MCLVDPFCIRHTPPETNSLHLLPQIISGHVLFKEISVENIRDCHRPKYISSAALVQIKFFYRKLIWESEALLSTHLISSNVSHADLKTNLLRYFWEILPFLGRLERTSIELHVLFKATLGQDSRRLRWYCSQHLFSLKCQTPLDGDCTQVSYEKNKNFTKIWDKVIVWL